MWFYVECKGVRELEYGGENFTRVIAHAWRWWCRGEEALCIIAYLVWHLSAL